MGMTKTTSLAMGLVLAGSGAAWASTPSKLARPLTTQGSVRTLGSSSATQGATVYSVRLASDPLAASPATIEAEQQAFLARNRGLRVVGRARHVLNAVFVEVEDPALATELLADPTVRKLTQVGHYEKDLSETVPYIGASAVQSAGIDGTGVRVAVLDSGVDYLHADLGGSGSVIEYDANNPDVIEPGSFPTAKVVGGFDFVGEVWPDGPVQPDPDPLDADGHGTHVADIIGGRGGVAPGASILAVKVCSAVASSCNGVALIQGMDFAVDPNGDGDTSDHVDIINMSLGSNYGQPFDDDLVLAVENATRIGAFTVASAGNGSDKPYVTGTPAAAESALSVAQTAVPSSTQDFMEILSPPTTPSLVPAVFQTWSAPLAGSISGTVVYGDGAGGNLNGCAPFAAGTFAAGSIVVVDRGACNFSAKISNIEAGGGALGIIALVAPGAPFPGGFGGGTPPTIPGYMIDQDTGDVLRAGATVSFDPANGVSLAGSMVSSSSRGPRNGDSLLKPEIGAPGASVSAEVGTGTERTPFGGTSGAAPMVTGAAVLLKESRPWASPQLLKLLLMNGANPNITIDYNGVPAEVSRIGAGEVNVFSSFESKLKVSTTHGGTSALSLGFVPVWEGRKVIRRQVVLTNDLARGRRLAVTTSFRRADDAASGALEIRAPSSVWLGAGATKTITVAFVINGASLPANAMSSGGDGADPATLTAMEFDGYVNFADETDDVSVPWHVIPRKSARVRGRQKLRLSGGSDTIQLRNHGVGVANADAYTLLALSNNLPAGAPGQQEPTPDLRAVGVQTVPVDAGFCSESPSFLLKFAFNSWEPQTNVLPVIFFADIDVDNDGTADFQAINGDLGYQLQDSGNLEGQSVAIAYDLAADTGGAFFFAEHATNTTNTVITYCAEQFGLSAADLGNRDITVSFGTRDFYFGGPNDTLDPVTFTLGGGYAATVADIAAGALESMTVTDNGGNSPDLGILLVTDGDRGAGDRGAATPETEALLFLDPSTPQPY